MAEEKLLTVRDVSTLLGISERQVLDMAENGTIPAYKIGGVYLRFRKDQIEEFKKRSSTVLAQRYSFQDQVSDFFYYNDFYLFCGMAGAVLIYVILFS